MADDNTTKASKKRKLTFDNEILSPLNLQSIVNKQKISTTVIEKFWQPLDSVNAQSMDDIMNIALLKTLDESHSKVSRSITNVWFNSANPESFKSRLLQTKLPPPSSMYSSKLRIRANEVADVLSYDSLTRKRTVLETYLSAELKQLQELENHYNQSLLAYKSDLEYLKKFKSTVKNNEMKYNDDLERKHEELNLSVQDKNPDDIYLLSTDNDFDPETDDDIKFILETIQEKLLRSKLKTLNDKLEVLCNILA
ncbi:conserved hypothetical protein [Candida dubliniensis CD36]|uniref:Uncharacterized protein n=1 Tax=Candida dubliniensis (strain CD36 / ATCC MYA-646 / CBS 7987 / NCPF 3949 / NRRL Y-17841) TaxID=573826 RepID=B9WAX7_CANDC|nr:conserved hypothetical protein [Candida dubliniensis CD36]CAX43547.1 conserved hypothetical protein [Candida dubliniensis CD36]